MKRPLIVLLSTLLAACGSAPQLAPETPALSPQLERDAQGHAYLRGQLVIGYDRAEYLETAVRQLDARVLQTIPQLRAAVLEVDGPFDAALKRALTLPGLRYAQPNYATVRSPRTDAVERVRTPESGALRPLSLDQTIDEYPQYALDSAHLNARAAWQAGLEGAGVTVAVIDDPVDVTHPDLAANWGGKAYDPVQKKVYTSAQLWKNFASANPDNSHGTFVASTIAAARDGRGIVGLAPKSRYLPVAIFTPAFVGDAAVANGLAWAVDSGAQVLNNSWGGPAYDQLLKDAFDYALSKGAIPIAAAGNDYVDAIQYPANYPGVVASVAAGANRQRAYFSNYGRHVSSAAPGFDVLLANPTWLGGGYGLISGTSFSSPYTAAAAALVLGRCPTATPYQVRRLLEETADATVGSNPSGFDRETGYGHLDLGRTAQRLTSCAALPAPGASALLNVAHFDGPSTLADVMLVGKGMRPADPNDATPIYWARTDRQGQARFLEVAPGEYDVYVAASDRLITGDLPQDRATYAGTVTLRSGSTAAAPDTLDVLLSGQAPNLNPSDPFEPNDDEAGAKPLPTGERTPTAFIHGKPRDRDFYTLEARAGEKIQLRAYARRTLGGLLDPVMSLYTAGGANLLAYGDPRQGPEDADTLLQYTFTADGTYTVVVDSFHTVVYDEDDDSPFNRYQLELTRLPQEN
ncbi:subtilisin family serine protease [Deinobacterium chartae]|uniref:Subtilisin family serine protease n=1 Tax=Deinobacterium chartae TaxID=521158 RepID=A0A841I0K5_9DEIO|nr:S8 family serine peptidase [Deinobacterium chartae]MBB6098733.1 subtilisin family serine protease [Deinobacterium chartae]